MCKHAEKENGLQDLMEIMMVAERGEFLRVQEDRNKGNGFRLGHTYGHGRRLEFKIPRDRYGNFHPKILAILRDQEEECKRLSGSLFCERTIINYPKNALRELMMNACMHRDYQANMPTRLYQFDDHIEIMNAGGLYGEARPENFPMVNDYRNPIIAEAMKEMKYVNMFNQGVKRVQDMLRENGNKEAKFDVSKLTVFCVDVFSNEDTILQTTTQTTTQTLSEVQITILEYIHSHPNASRIEIAAHINGITENGVKYHMQKLQKQGILKRVGADFGGHWEIIPHAK